MDQFTGDRKLLAKQISGGRDDQCFDLMGSFKNKNNSCDLKQYKRVVLDIVKFVWFI